MFFQVEVSLFVILLLGDAVQRESLLKSKQARPMPAVQNRVVSRPHAELGLEGPDSTDLWDEWEEGWFWAKTIRCGLRDQRRKESHSKKAKKKNKRC